MRIAVLVGFVTTVWIVGPKAWRVLAARASVRAASHGEPVAVDRIRLVADPPEWLRGPVLRAVLVDLEPRLHGEVRIMDVEGARTLSTGLSRSPWVRDAKIERRFPDRFRVAIDLRRPLLEVRSDGNPLALVATDGVALPAPELPTGLPVTTIDGIARGAIVFGELFPDARVLAAAAVAREWTELVLPTVRLAPELVEIDASNLDWKYVADASYSQIVIGLACDDGGTAYMHYGRAEADGGPVRAAVKAKILESILELHPGLVGLEGGDLRRRNLWRHCLRPRG